MPSTRGSSPIRTPRSQRQPHHHGVAAVAVVAAAPVDLGEARVGVERQRALVGAPTPRAASAPASAAASAASDLGSRVAASRCGAGRGRRRSAAGRPRRRPPWSPRSRDHVVLDHARPAPAGRRRSARSCDGLHGPRVGAEQALLERDDGAPRRRRRRDGPAAGSRDLLRAAGGGRVRAAQVERLGVEQLGALVGDDARRAPRRDGCSGPDGVRERVGVEQRARGPRRAGPLAAARRRASTTCGPVEPLTARRRTRPVDLLAPRVGRDQERPSTAPVSTASTASTSRVHTP